MTMMGVMATSGLVILISALAATTILRKRSASLRHLIWTVSLGLLVAIPVFEFVDLRIELPVPAAWVGVVGGELLAGPALVGDVATAGDSDRLVSPKPSGPAAIESHGVGLSRDVPARIAAASDLRQESRRKGSLPPAVVPADPVAAPGLGTSEDGAVASTEEAGAGLGWSALLLLIWALGSIVLLAGTLFSHLAARRLVQRDVERASPQAARRFASLCVELGIQRPVRLVVNPRVRVPATWGFLRPAIVLPPHYATWEAETLDRVLLHELAHVQRGDCLAALLGECARALHWPNPLAWIALSRQRAESEHACDDLVLRAGQRPSDYARDLLRLVQSFSTSAPLPEASLAMARPSGLGRRVRAVLDPSQHRGATRRSAVVSFGLIAVLSAFGATAVVPVARAQEEPARPDAPAPADALARPDTPAPPDALARPDARTRPDAPGRPAAPAAGPGVVPSAPAEAPTHVDSPLPYPAEVPSAPGWAESRRTLPAGSSELGESPYRRVSRAPGFFPFAELPQVDPGQELCVFRDEGTRSSSVNSDRERVRIRWETEGCRVEVEIDGSVDFSSDDTGIDAMTRGSVFDIEERIGDTSRRVRLEGTRAGIERTYWVDGVEIPWSGEAEGWMGRILPELFRHTTINAEARVRRFLVEGGAERVFREIESIHSDHVTSRYLELLMREAELSEEQYIRTIDYAGQLDSDHAASELLLAVAETAGLRPAFQRPMLRAAESIGSDHQKTRVLLALLEADLGPSQVDAVVESAMTIGSDHMLSDILSTVATTGRLSEMGRLTYLRALDSVASDHNKAQVLEAFMDSGRVTGDEVTRVLDMTEGISSDHQRAMILQRVARDFPLTGDQVTAYLRSAADLESDHQVAMTAAAIIDRADFTREHMALVLTMADGIGSDHQRATVLDRVVLRQELSTPELEEVLMVAEGLDSDHQLASTLTLILEDETLSQGGVAAVLGATRQLRSDHERTSVLLKLAGIYEVRGDARRLYEELAEGLGRNDQRRAMEALRG